MHTISKVREKLSDPEYRKAFVASQIKIGIPFQIRALLKSRPGWTQETLAAKTGMLQPRISGLMSPGKTRPNIETLRRIAEAFDCGLIVRFVPFSELARWTESFDPESFFIPAFDDDSGFVEHKPALIGVTIRERFRRFVPPSGIDVAHALNAHAKATLPKKAAAAAKQQQLAFWYPKAEVSDNPSMTSTVESIKVAIKRSDARRI